MAYIRLENASLTFHIRRTAGVGLKDYVIKQLFRRSKNPPMEVRALQNINLNIDAGTRLGVVGHNGAGKSTFLKLLAGVYPVTSGRVVVNGRISSLFDINLGFEMESNGWENIQFRGLLQGETPKSIRAKAPAIAEFTELGDFLNGPIRHYSAGMLVRLAFSVATAVEPEILLVDESLSAGDLAFQAKAKKRIHELCDRAELVVLVSHDLAAIQNLCNRAIWLDRGQLRMQGEPGEVVEAYREYQIQKGIGKPAQDKGFAANKADESVRKPATLESFAVAHGASNEKRTAA
jgi:ABC-type polysaccharide/polyol phosphate transport system ATPase subunit